MKAKMSRSEQEIPMDESDKESAYYAKNINKFQHLLNRRKKDIQAGESKKFDNTCQLCGKPGHFAKNCRVKPNEVLIATWSDEDIEDEDFLNQNNLALMAWSSFDDSDVESQVSNSYDELFEAFELLHTDYQNALNEIKSLKYKYKSLENENSKILEKGKFVKIDHSKCIKNENTLKDDLVKVQTELKNLMKKFSLGNEKFENMLSV